MSDQNRLMKYVVHILLGVQAGAEQAPRSATADTVAFLWK